MRDAGRRNSAIIAVRKESRIFDKNGEAIRGA